MIQDLPNILFVAGLIVGALAFGIGIAEAFIRASRHNDGEHYYKDEGF